ncbi:MAG TPA: DMT family transporter [Devosia sp.]|nr:DMT family transporter [Devosia sp.]
MTATTPAAVEDRRNFGIGLLVFSTLFFATLDTCAKWLALAGLPAFQIVFVRYAVHLALIVALFLPVRGFKLFRTGDWKLEVVRGLCMAGITLANFYALQYLPLTVTGALLFTMPLMVCLLAAPMLGEKVGWRRATAAGVGFIGVLIIVRPGTEAFHPAAILCLFGAFSGALYAIFTRKLAGVDSAATQTTYAGLVAVIAITPFAFDGWVWPSDVPTWIAFVAIGIAGVLAQQLHAIAHRHASPTVLAPFSYLQLLGLAASSWFIFGQPPDVWFYVGAPIIILSGFYIFLREQKLRRQPSLAPVEE